MPHDGMAYRGDATDPLEHMINRNRATKRVVLLLLAWWLLPQLVHFNWSVFEGVFDSTSPRSSAPIAAPTANAAPGGKMSASALEQLLRSAPASHAPRDVRCLPLQNGWDYVCTYQGDMPQPQTRWKIGVRVSANTILQASAPHPSDKFLGGP
jgi:hypothetical protein